jgi:hypothetical protein
MFKQKKAQLCLSWLNFVQIPSTYAPERLDLLRQLEKVKEMEISSDANAVEEPETVC